MLNLSDKELDRLSREAASAYDPGEPAGAGSWDRLKVNLDKELGKAAPNTLRAIRRYPFYYAPAILLLAGISYYFVKQGRNSSRAAPASATPANPDPITQNNSNKQNSTPYNQSPTDQKEDQQKTSGDNAGAKTAADASAGARTGAGAGAGSVPGGGSAADAGAGSSANAASGASVAASSPATTVSGSRTRAGSGSPSGGVSPAGAKAGGANATDRARTAVAGKSTPVTGDVTTGRKVPGGVDAATGKIAGKNAGNTARNKIAGAATSGEGSRAKTNTYGQNNRIVHSLPGGTGRSGSGHTGHHGTSDPYHAVTDHTGKDGAGKSSASISSAGRPATGQTAMGIPSAGNETPANPSASNASTGNPAPFQERDLARSVVGPRSPLARGPFISDSALRKLTSRTALNTAGLINVGKKNGQSLHIDRSFQIGFNIAPDFASVHSLAGDRPGSQTGITLDYQFFNRWYIGTGLLYSKRNYTARSEDYHVPPYYYQMNNMHDVNYIRGSFSMLEIPLNLRYDFSVAGNTVFFASAGVSAYLHDKENCSYYYSLFGREAYRKFVYPVQHSPVFSVVNLSMGVEAGISNSFSLLVAPYMKIPTSAIGFGQIQMNSIGVDFALKYSPILRRKRK